MLRVSPHQNMRYRKDDNVSTHRVDFPAPLGPTMAILESSPTSKLMPFKSTLSGVYPNVTSLSCSTGGEIFSVSGNLNVSVSSASGGVSSGSYSPFKESAWSEKKIDWEEIADWLTFSRILIFDCACAARFALYRHRSMKACRCLRYSIWVSYSLRRFLSRSVLVE
jgi:hypothetical protein